MRIRPAARRLGTAAASDDEGWEKRAACTPDDADLLTADSLDTQRMAARAICHGRQCPVMYECDQEARPYGVWGGRPWSWHAIEARRRETA